MPMLPCLSPPPRPAPSRAELLDRARGAMLGLALGDALGATVEFMTPREIALQYGVHRHIRGGGWLRLAAGEVTDDTTMSLALAGAWLDYGGPPSAEACARAFDAWMSGKPVDIGNTVRRGIARWRVGGGAQAPQSNDAGNGATMRCLPAALGSYGAPREQVAEAALSQARVTHHNPLTDAATLCVVEMLHCALAGAGREAVLARARALAQVQPAFRFDGARLENPGGYIVDTFRAVCQALDEGAGAGDDEGPDVETVLVDVVNRGGDADTTGAIAGMIAGALAGERGLPAAWLAALRAPVREACGHGAEAVMGLSPGFLAAA